MSDPTVTGRIHLIEETKTYGAKGFRKRLVVLEQENGKWTNYVPVSFVQDACDQTDELNQGQTIEVSYTLKGRKWQKDDASEPRYFLDLEATGIVTQEEHPNREPWEKDDAQHAASAPDDDVPF